MASRIPYPGLRAFGRDEADLFFGRDDAIDTMVERLLASRFLGVLGASGSGKSSLVRTGLFEALEGGLSEAGSRWRIADCRPGGRPIANLARALSEASQKEEEFEDSSYLEAYLRRGPRAIVEWCQQGHIESGWKLLILVDQFEELFSYPSLAAREDADAYAALLVESARSDEAPIYVVATMRSDYFGACGAHPALAEKISEGIFLTPRISRDGCRDAILCPAAIVGFDIAPDLLNTLLNDIERFAPFEAGGLSQPSRIGRQADQLPLMQYVLNRMWMRAAPQANGRIELRLEDYRAIGGLEGALDAHGEEVLARLGADEGAVARVLRTLVRGPNVALATRDPRTIGEIAAITELDPDLVTRIVLAFGSNDCLFLRVEQPATPDSFVDLTHESLIRQWHRLAGWLVAEATAAEMWRALVGEASFWRAEGEPDEALLSGLALARRREWWAGQQPNPAWAARYSDADGPGVEEVGAFLERSEANRLEGEKARARQRKRLRLAGGGGVAVILLLLSAAGVQQIRIAEAKLLDVERTEIARKKEEVALARDRERLLNTERLYNRLQMETASRRDAVIKAEKAKELALASAASAIVERNRAQAARNRAQAAVQAATTAYQATFKALETNFEQIRVQQRAIGASADVVAQQYAQLARVVYTLKGSDPAAQRELAGRVQLEAAAAQIDRLGLGEDQPKEGGPGGSLLGTGLFVRESLPAARAPEVDPATTARSYIVQGRMEEIEQAFTLAAASYEAALSRSGSVPGPASAAINMEASARLGALAWRLGDFEQAKVHLDRCSQAAESAQSAGPAFVSEGGVLQALECEKISADLALEQGDRDLGMKKLRDLIYAFDDSSPFPARQLELEIRTKMAGARESSEPVFAIDDDLLDEAKRIHEANEGSEKYSGLYAGLLEAKDDFDAAFDVRYPLLYDRRTTLGYLVESEHLIREFLASLGPEDSGVRLTHHSYVSEPQLDDNPRSSFARIRRYLAMYDVLTRLQETGAPPVRGLGPDPVPDRSAIAESIRRRFESNLANTSDVLTAIANRENLLDDLTLSENAYLTGRDGEEVQRILHFLNQYKAACRAYHPDAVQDLVSMCLRSHEAAAKSLSPLFAAKGRLLGGTDMQMRNPWLGGYDPLSYAKSGRPVRGRTDLSHDVEGRPVLFSTPENLAEFRQAPSRYMPQYDGHAAEWMSVGEVYRGDLRSFCVADGRLFLLATYSKSSWCGSGAIAAADAAWRRLSAMEGGRPAAHRDIKFSSPVPSVNPQPTGLAWRFAVPPGSPVLAPAGGLVFMVRTEARRQIVEIEHADGTTSLLRLGSSPLTVGQMVARGAQIGSAATGTTASPVTVTWELLRGSGRSRRAVRIPQSTFQ